MKLLSSELHLRASSGDDLDVYVLLQTGADIEALDHSYQRPLHLACKNGENSTVNLLIDSGAEVCSFL